MPKTFLITGATGLIGGHLTNALIGIGEDVIVATTNVENAKQKLKTVKRFINLQDYLSLKDEKIDVIINLAGVSVGDKRWDNEFKNKILRSRVDATKMMIELISVMNQKPELLINSSGIDYYGDTGDTIVDENSPPGNLFLSEVCKQWEAEAAKAGQYGTRVVMFRTGFVMAKDSKAVKRLVMPYRFFAGGPTGSGQQYMPWIHIDDVTGMFLFAADNKEISGAVNMCSPNPDKMKIFSRNLGKAIGRPSWFPVPAFMLKLVIGQMAEVILTGRRAIPKKILEAGYKFQFENSLDAWKEVTGK